MWSEWCDTERRGSLSLSVPPLPSCEPPPTRSIKVIDWDILPFSRSMNLFLFGFVQSVSIVLDNVTVLGQTLQSNVRVKDLYKHHKCIRYVVRLYCCSICFYEKKHRITLFRGFLWSLQCDIKPVLQSVLSVIVHLPFTLFAQIFKFTFAILEVYNMIVQSINVVSWNLFLNRASFILDAIWKIELNHFDQYTAS